MELTYKDLENISQGNFSKVNNWKSHDMDPNRVILPTFPYLFINYVELISNKNIIYICKPKDNPLFNNVKYLPPGIALEFFQGYMLLCDYLGISKVPVNAKNRSHRTLGGDIIFTNNMPSIDQDLYIEITITKSINIGKTTIINYDGQMRANNKDIVCIKNAKGIFYEELQNRKPIINIPSFDQPIKEYKIKFPNDKLSTFDKLTLHKKNILVAEKKISKDDWFFKCHFIHDPCMPGSLILQSAYDMFSNYKGANVNPKLNEVIKGSAKLHVLPENKKITMVLDLEQKKYDVFVDGQHAFFCKNIDFI